MLPGTRRRCGFVLVTMMVSTVAVLSVIGLAIDTGHLQLVKVRMQTAADAGALGAVQARRASGSADVVAAARTDAGVNGFTHDQNSVTVSVNSPPSTGFYTGDSTAVEVIVRRPVKTFFMSLAGFHTVDVTARSVARRGPGTSCVYVLDPSVASAMTASGGAIVNVDCAAYVNSSDDRALTVSGGARINADAVKVVGNYNTSGGGVISPAPTIHVPAEPDPLAHIPAPTVGGCNQTNFHLSSGGVQTISEGVYCGGIQISGGSRLTLNPGNYILKGGGLSVSGGSTLTGSGVTFYNTFGGGYSYGAISLSGGCTVQLKAPTAGPRAAILFFQDRTVVNGANSNITGGATSLFDGALYFPTTALSYSGGTGTDYTFIVAKTLSFTGGTTVNSDYSSLPTGPPVKGSATLGE